MATRILVVLAVVVLTGYGLVEAYPLVRGPVLTLTSPNDYAEFPDGIVVLEGEAKRVVALTLNGAPLLLGEDGTFKTALAFPKGASILTFVAKDRFGRTITHTRTIYIP